MTQYAIPMYKDGSLGCEDTLDHDGDRQSLLKRLIVDYDEHSVVDERAGYLILDSEVPWATPEILYAIPSVTFSTEKP